jgi:murein DD-endopeptidase
VHDRSPSSGSRRLAVFWFTAVRGRPGVLPPCAKFCTASKLARRPDDQYIQWMPLYALLACSLLLNVFLLMRGPSAPEQVADAEPVAAEPAEVASAPAAPAAAARADAEVDDAGWSVLRGTVEQSLARTFQVEAGEGGDALASVFTRLFVWDLDLRRDLQKGDALAVAWRKGADGFPEIAAASLQTRKLGQTVTAYRWQAPGDRYASYWHLDGTEAPLRLKDGPLEDYEQITSLLKDRPSHKGMDFKTPVGTEVRSPRAAVVTRANWNWGANGNCLELRYEDGTLAKFLHLSENKVKEGDRVAKGQLVALTGNTGRSTAPHLHYQLDRDNRTIDPLDYHGTERRSLVPEQLAALKRDVAAFESMLAGGGSAASTDGAPARPASVN